MTVLRRSAALLLALVVFMVPLALERCRTACVQASAPQPVTTAAHACHEAVNTDDGPALSPEPRACPNSDDARIADAALIAPAKIRLEIGTAPAAFVSPLNLHSIAPGPASPGPPRPSSLDTPRNLPLRL